MLLPCGCRACGCKCGKLPYVIDATFSDMELKEFCPLAISSNFGSGASAVITEVQDGVVTAVQLLSGGTGYARRARTAPTLSAAGSGTGATFSVSLSTTETELCDDTWSVESVSVSGGTGYSYGESLSITAASGDTVVVGAQVALQTERQEPDAITANVAGGTGAAFEVSFSENEGSDPPTWGISSVTVLDGGSGYSNGTAVTFSVTHPNAQLTSATATIAVTSSEPPDVESLVFFTSTLSGGGATFSFSWTPNGDEYDLVVTLVDGGSGYAVGEEVTWLSDTEFDAFTAMVIDTVDENGAITAISVLGAEPFKGFGAIDSVTVAEPGEYFNDTGVPESASVVNGGQYYKIDLSQDPCLAEITVSGCGGSDAEYEVTIDQSNTPAFGQVTGISVVNGGSGYISPRPVLSFEADCFASLNGKTLKLLAQQRRELVEVRVVSDSFGVGGCVLPVPPDWRLEPDAALAVQNGVFDQPGELSVTLEENTDDFGRPYWSVSGATAAGGTGYRGAATVVLNYPGDLTGNQIVRDVSPQVSVTATPLNGDFPETGGVLTGATVITPGRFWYRSPYTNQPTPIYGVTFQQGGTGSGYALRGREEPTMTITVPGWPSNFDFASFAATLTEREGEHALPYWEVDSISVTGGSGYADNRSMDIVVSGSIGTPDFFVRWNARRASAKLRTRRDAPVLNATVVDPAGIGSGAVLSVVLEEAPKNDPESVTERKLWQISRVDVVAAGDNYNVIPGSQARITLTPATSNDKVVSAASLYAIAAPAGGISSVLVDYGGRYWRESGIPQTVQIDDGGAYFQENDDLPPYVATPTAVVTQFEPSDGSGLEIALEVQDDPLQQNFGRLKSATVTDPGDGYVLWGGPKNCRYSTQYRGPGSLFGFPCPRYDITLDLLGDDKPIEVKIDAIPFRTSGTISNCEDLPTPATSAIAPIEGQIAIAAGELPSPENEFP